MVNKDRVSIIKLVTGEELISEVILEDVPGKQTVIKLQTPFIVQLFPDATGLAKLIMMPFCMYRKDPEKNPLLIDIDKVVYVTDPGDKILDQYIANTSKLALPANGSGLQLIKG